MQICRALLTTSLVLIISLGAPGAWASNQLAGHPSPYLALHAGDPVNWRPWQAEVFKDARQDNRLVYVSVGYFSCHWCHVMQQESYQDEGIAKLLNQNYIAVKVDRELDPDLDRRLIDFVEKTRGSAGWPLNVFLTPDGYPIAGFTYLPSNVFANVLQELDDAWQQDQDQLAKAARNFFETQMQDQENQAFVAPQIPSQELIGAFISQTMLLADELQGGIGNTSKFPNVPQLDSLLTIIKQNPELDKDVVDFVQLSLRMMTSKNLYDHVNNGFFRYTTDPDWHTPHFEKMLYDNAQLAMLYLRAHELWPNQGHADIAMRTLDFVEANLKHPDGGYMSSLSAVDVNNKEGGAYFWSSEQLAAVLEDQEVEYLSKLWPVETKTSEFLIKPLTGQGASGKPAKNLPILEKLQSRGSKNMPVDDKRLASWNAMLLDALTAATDIDSRYAERARALFLYMRNDFYRADSLIRFAGNAGAAEAVLEDYAQVARSFLNFGKRFGSEEATRFAMQLTESAYALFLKNGRWQQKAESLIPIAPGKWVIPDQVFFSPMTLWIEVALEVPGLNPTVRSSANEMLQRATREMLDSPYFYGSFIMLRANNQS